MAQAVTGKVVHYDANRGFGFLAPESGGADVFLHINDIDIDESELKPGAQVEFEVEETERGSKATNVSVIGSAPAAPPRGGRRDDSDHGRDHGARSYHGSRDHGSRDQGRDRAAAPRRASRGSDSAVLDSAVFTEELTELLLDSSGSLTAEQIIAIRSRVTDFAIARGWVVD
ncbi:cold-shock protein [Williamsia sp.]|uniref:cold-shock protein n=1 Tax=Williamsia sp. TaxID=1872085 RepID=UPI001A261CDE|nr:cold shock domain-containing protein [Williamsia sp.]MBJ7288157.1 cold shock domain-containing protein [Williamsia sp.]